MLHILLLAAPAALQPTHQLFQQQPARGPTAAVSLPSFARLNHLRGGRSASEFFKAAIPAVQPEVLRSSLGAVSELLTCCGIGVAATKVGFLDSATTKALARVVYSLFLPAMLATSVARSVALGGGWSLLQVSLAAPVQVGIALALVVMLLGPRVALRTTAGREQSVLAAFGNAGVLPLVFADALFRHDALLHARANSLVALYLLGWSPLFWTVGYSLLGSRSLAAADPGGPQLDVVERANMRREWWSAFRRRVLTPPILGCLAGLLVGSLPPLRALLLPASAGGSALCVLPIYRCLSYFGKGYGPAALLVLASSLALKPPEAPAILAAEDRDDGDGTTTTMDELGFVMLVRFVLMPLVVSGLLGLAKSARLLAPDPLRDFMLLLQATMPSAQNTVLALQVSAQPNRASRMARLLLAIYLSAALPIAVVLSVALQSSGVLVGI